VELTKTARDGVALRIRDARVAKGWSQSELAEAVGVSRSAVAQWETARAGQISINLGRIARALGVGVEWLLHGSALAAADSPLVGDELALLRLYRACSPADRQVLLRLARRLGTGGG
jgi:transcriptional regulator with XRE-family HTH domain